MGKLCIDELDIAFVHGSRLRIRLVHQKRLALTAC